MWTLTFILGTIYLSSPLITAVPPSNEEHLTRANAQFAIDLYNQIGEETDGNIFFCPISVSTALAMTHLGAKGKTATQMAEVLQFDDISFDVHELFKTLLTHFNDDTSDYTLSIANRLFGRKNYDFHQEYIDKTRDVYGAPLEELDFQGNQEGSRQVINEWVKDQTMGKIEDFLPDGFIDQLTVLVLVNAVYFKGVWKVPFNITDTMPRPFYLNDGKVMDIDTMSLKQRIYFKYTEDDELDVQILSLPYKGDEITFDILLPKNKQGLSSLEGKLTAGKLKVALNKVYNTRLAEIALPKFEIEQKIDLKDILADMGMTDLFDAEKANLTGIADGARLVVSDVLHEAYIKVNEEGTEASAATGIGIGVASLPLTPSAFIADHPFIYLIRQSGDILFMGRFVSPLSGEEIIGDSRRGSTDDSEALLPSLFTYLTLLFWALYSSL